MTESTPNEASMPAEPALPQAPEPQAAEPPATGKCRRRLLLVVAVAVAAILIAVVVAVLVSKPDQAKVGDCVKDTAVVGCDQPHDTRITQIVNNVNDCAPPATHAIKQADGRYLCLAEEVPS
jgi:hypothetical protein